MAASLRFWTTVLILATAAILFGSHVALGAKADDPLPGSYRVVDGKVDPGTYTGWFVYHMACHICHGEGAVGTDIAPDLRKSLKTLTQTGFADKVLNRYRVLGLPKEPATAESARRSVIEEVTRHHRGPRGRLSMPAWQDDRAMAPHILDLYAYLKARSDGAIGAGPPQYYK